MGGIYSKTTKLDPAAREIIGSSSYTPVDREIINASDVYSCKFTNYSSSYAREIIGNYLVSNTFMSNNGEYSWAIYFYPNGKELENFASFVIQLKSKPSNQEDEALFKLALVDQSGKGNHCIHIRFGLAHKGCEWKAFISKHLEGSVYLKDDCIQVFCWISIYKTKQLKEDLKKETASSLIINTESWLRLTQRPLFYEYRFHTDEYLEAVDKIQELKKSGMITDYQSKGINVMDMAMKRLQLEFEGILKCSTNKVKYHIHIWESSTIYSSSVSTSSYELHDTEFLAHGAFSIDQVMHLCSIIARLNSYTGFLGDCIEMYKISRKYVVDATFSRFDIEKCAIGKIWSSDWEEGIKLWIRTIDACFQTIFPRENKYFEQIFGAIESATYDDCFLFIITDAVIQLCNFAETITTTPATFERLFGVLDLYRAMLLILPEIKATFHSSSSVNVYFGAAKIVDLLAELVRQIISVFEDTVLNEQLNTPVPERIIHPLTTYSMNYVIGMLKFKELLTEIIISKPTISLGISDDDMQFLEVGGQTTLALHLVWILIILKFNLEGKSKQYADTSMGHLFMIKNVELIIVKIEQCSVLLEMIGMDYPTMLRQYVAKKTITYVDSIRDKALHCLRDGLNHKFRYFNRISKSALKKRFKIFNAMLEDFFRTRSTWLESDLQFQRQLHKLMLEELIPAYESFLVKYRSRVESEKYPEKYIKFLPDDLRTMSSMESPKLRDFFVGRF